MTFQAWKIKFLDSMTFQVFHILYEPCPDWHGIPPPTASGSRRRVHKDQGWDSQRCILSTACVAHEQRKYMYKHLHLRYE